MLPTPATELRRASAGDACSRSWLTINSVPTGTITHVTMRRMSLMPLRNSERARLKRRASSASWAAYASAPTFSARHQPCPAATKLPESTGSPSALSTGSDSPERSDSSSSSPVPSRTTPSTTSWSPGRSSSTSSSTTSSTLSSTLVPLRRACTFGAASTARRSSVRRARSSWTTPTSTLLTSTMPKSESWKGPTTMMTTSSPPRSALKRVTTLARTMWATLRLEWRSTQLV